MLGVSITALLLSAATIVGCAWYFTQTHKANMDLAARQYEAARDLARSQHNDATKFASVLLASANAISEKVDHRVQQRIAVINRTLNPRPQTDEDAPSNVDDPPPMTQSFMDEVHEIGRELRRFRRDGEFDPVREPGVGAEEV